MIARYAGTCRACGMKITRGSEIVWSRQNGPRHAACANTTSPDAATSQAAYHASRGPQLDDDGRPTAYAYDPGARAYICPTCRNPNLNRLQVTRRYQCEACADEEEGLGYGMPAPPGVA